MAKRSESVTFKNLIIDMKDRTFSEINKEDTRVFLIDKVLKEWSGIPGLTLSIRLDGEVPQDGEGD